MSRVSMGWEPHIDSQGLYWIEEQIQGHGAWLEALAQDPLIHETLPKSSTHLHLSSTTLSRPHQLHHEKYHGKNIIRQIQQQPIPNKGVDEPEDGTSYNKAILFPLYQQLGVPESNSISESESQYIHYFVREFPMNLGVNQSLQTSIGEIIGRSMFDEVLRNMILAVSSFLVDNICNRPPLRSYKYLQLGLPHIKKGLSDGTVDDSLIYSVYLAACLHSISGELASCRQYLQALHVLLQRYQAVPGSPGHAVNPPPEMMLIWRMAIRMDHTWAMGDQESVFPLAAPQEDLHRGWIQLLVPHDQPEMVEWILAQFALDDLLTRAINIMKKAILLRKLGTHKEPDKIEAAIEMETKNLFNELNAWTSRPCISIASIQTTLEQCMSEDASLPDDANAVQFLHYPPLKISNKLYGALLVQYYWTFMYLTFITHPQPGPFPVERFQAAVDLGRTYAAIGGGNSVGVSRLVLGLYLTGLTLGEPMYPTEFAWIGEQFHEFDRLRGYRAGSTVWNILRTTWRSDGPHWKHYKAGHNR